MKAFAPDRNLRFATAADFRDALEGYLFAPSLDHGPTLVDVPERPEVITLGGGPAIEPAPPPAVAFQAPPPAAKAPPEAPAGDPFAPARDASEPPLELAAPRTPGRAATAPVHLPAAAAATVLETHPLQDLQQYRRAALARQLWARRIIFTLTGIAVIIGALIWWTREPPPQ